MPQIDLRKILVYIYIWEFPKIRGTFFWVLYRGYIGFGDYRV